jgi:hypothetical protein
MNRRSLLGYTMLAVAALLKWPRSIGTALADDKNWRHGVSLIRRSEISGRVQAFRLYHRRCAERRYSTGGRTWHL